MRRDPPDSSQSIVPPNWDELAPLLDAILDAPAERRQEMLADIGKNEPGSREALESMLADCERGAPLLEQTALTRFDQLVDEAEFHLPDVLSGRYRTGRELGRGGMARVYLARDLKHERDVAVKVILPELAASLGRHQFLREIGIAARLRHPNIVPLFDSGDDSGVLYFVMPLEAGPSLRETLRLGPLSTPDAVGVLRDVARALAYAHAQGVVHRDVKPDNVMLSSGAAVVTDFGIATAVRVAQAGSPDQQSPGGAATGTPAYMAPEQAMNDSGSDHRADIYSFGCMAYELFTGRPPFEGSSAAEIITGHVSRRPQPVNELRADIPHAVAQVVTRCLEKNPDDRPQSASEIVAALDALAGASIALGANPRRRRVAGVTIALAASLALGAFLISARDEQLSPPRAPAPATLAVLPLASVGGDSTRVMFAEGLGEEIASALVKTPWVRIMSRRGVANYRGRGDIDYRQAGRDLGARYLLTGSVREYNGHEIVSLRLLDAEEGSALWAETFDRPSSELEAQRDEIALSIAQALRRVVPGALAAQSPPPRMERHTSGEAYFYQVQAQQWLDRRGTRVQASAEYFRRAIAIDPNYAKAYSGLSLALALYPYFQSTPSKDIRNELIAVARKALQLDPTLAQPHIALGMAYQYEFEWDRAGAEFTTAIRLAPHDVEARVQYGRYLLFRGRTREARAQFQAARENDPASALVLSWVSYTYYLERELDSALSISRRALKSNPLNLSAVHLGALVRIAAGQREEARQLTLEAHPGWPSTLYVLAVTGTPEAVMRARLASMANRRPRPWLIHTAQSYALLGIGDTAQALDALEKASDAGEIWPSINPATDPIFDHVRGSARFGALLRRVGLADAVSHRSLAEQRSR